jgi:uncharacterized protein (DUF1330 family)
MPAYMIVDTLLTDPEVYEEYKRRAKPLVEKAGGEYLARGGALTVHESDLWSPARIVIVKFPDAASANHFYASPEYQDILKLSKQGARRSLVIVEGM